MASVSANTTAPAAKNASARDKGWCAVVTATVLLHAAGLCCERTR